MWDQKKYVFKTGCGPYLSSHLVLIICCLFNDDVSRSGYMASNGR